ncbi:MAG: acetate--CoA ligase family protein [Anaerolineales bacterium]|nr:acetate--CoA ligase family protein [Anaerolineales bacterium]
MAKLLEHQGKAIFSRFKIPTPKSQLAGNVKEAQQAALEIGYPVVVKAQVFTGKRGHAGGVRVVENEAELTLAAQEILSSPIHGLDVSSLLIEDKVDVKQELYVGIAADPSQRTPVIIVCAEGGVDIEEIARENPQAIMKYNVDMLRGVFTYDALNVLRSVNNLTSKEKLGVARVICCLYEIYRAYDCKLVEINPLAVTGQGIMALDARVDIDGDALGRHNDLGIDHAEEAGNRASTLLEQIAATIDEGDHRGTVHFVQVDPDLAYIKQENLIPFGFDCVGAGASLTMMDELVPLGFYPVNFCDSSGNPVGSKLYRITKVIFSQPGIRGYVFVSCVSSQQLDNTARGIIKALKELYPETGGQPNIPTVLAFRGAWDAEAIKMLADHKISEGRWVRVLGRDSTEYDAAAAFNQLYQKWQAEMGVAA